MGWDVNCSERVLTGNSSDSYVCNQPKKARGEKHDGIKKTNIQNFAIRNEHTGWEIIGFVFFT